MGRPYSIGRYLKVKSTQSLNGAVCKMYNTDQKNDKHVPSSITPSASSSLSGVSPSSCNLSSEQTETSQSSYRETTGYQLCSNDLPFGRFSEGPCQRRRLSRENTQLATLRNTATETQSQARASRGQLSQWHFGEWRLPCALCQQGTEQHLQPTKKPVPNADMRAAAFSVLLGYGK